MSLTDGSVQSIVLAVTPIAASAAVGALESFEIIPVALLGFTALSFSIHLLLHKRYTDWQTWTSLGAALVVLTVLFLPQLGHAVIGFPMLSYENIVGGGPYQLANDTSSGTPATSCVCYGVELQRSPTVMDAAITYRYCYGFTGQCSTSQSKS